jgi:UDP-GlcNAc:undecaprenyl-phosphate GlcNAc-1-phosphate transferase
MLLLAMAPRIGWMDHPDQERKQHHRPTALTGGLALWIVVMALQLLRLFPWPLTLLDWFCIHAMALMGALDDRFGLRPRYKAALGLCVALVLAGHHAVMLAQATRHVTFLGFLIPGHPALIFPFLLAWFWSIPQAYNLIDGIHGLSMGFGLLVLATFSGLSSVDPGVLLGALGAIFLMNFPRAWHFLGDCGALMLGTLFSILCINLTADQNASLSLWIMAYPIVDVCLVVAVRRRNGTPFAAADRSHLHHCMLDVMCQRVGLATPLLLLLAGLPMLHTASFFGAQAVSGLGAIALLLLAVKAFLDRTHPRSRSIPSPSDSFAPTQGQDELAAEAPRFHRSA